MKENKLFKQVADKQMPDLEAIRKNCIEQKPQKSKAKILGLKTSRFVAVAATVTVLATGMVAVFANPGGVFFPTEPEVTVTEITTAATTAPQKTDKSENKAKSKSDSKKTSNSKAEKPEQSQEDKFIALLEDSDYSVTKVTELGEIDGYHIIYASDDIKYSYAAKHIIGDYVFKCETQCTPYGLGIFAVNDTKVYTLGDAYKEEIFESFGDAVQLIKDSSLDITAEETGGEDNALLSYFDAKTVSVADLGSVNDGRLFYNIDAEFNSTSATAEIGKYEFTCNESQKPYAFGVYFVKDNTVYTLEDAIEQEALTDIDNAVELINSGSAQLTKHFSISEKEEPTEEEETTEPTDEEETE